MFVYISIASFLSSLSCSAGPQWLSSYQKGAQQPEYLPYNGFPRTDWVHMELPWSKGTMFLLSVSVCVFSLRAYSFLWGFHWKNHLLRTPSNIVWTIKYRWTSSDEDRHEIDVVSKNLKENRSTFTYWISISYEIRTRPLWAKKMGDNVLGSAYLKKVRLVTCCASVAFNTAVLHDNVGFWKVCGIEWRWLGDTGRLEWNGEFKKDNHHLNMTPSLSVWAFQCFQPVFQDSDF